MEARTKINLHPKQEVAFKSDATEIGYGGAAGGGKSFFYAPTQFLRVPKFRTSPFTCSESIMMSSSVTTSTAQEALERYLHLGLRLRSAVYFLTKCSSGMVLKSIYVTAAKIRTLRSSLVLRCTCFLLIRLSSSLSAGLDSCAIESECRSILKRKYLRTLERSSRESFFRLIRAVSHTPISVSSSLRLLSISQYGARQAMKGDLSGNLSLPFCATIQALMSLSIQTLLRVSMTINSLRRCSRVTLTLLLVTTSFSTRKLSTLNPTSLRLSTGLNSGRSTGEGLSLSRCIGGACQMVNRLKTTLILRDGFRAALLSLTGNGTAVTQLSPLKAYRCATPILPRESSLGLTNKPAASLLPTLYRSKTEGWRRTAASIQLQTYFSRPVARSLEVTPPGSMDGHNLKTGSRGSTACRSSTLLSLVHTRGITYLRYLVTIPTLKMLQMTVSLLTARTLSGSLAQQGRSFMTRHLLALLLGHQPIHLHRANY